MQAQPCDSNSCDGLVWTKIDGNAFLSPPLILSVRVCASKVHTLAHVTSKLVADVLPSIAKLNPKRGSQLELHKVAFEWRKPCVTMSLVCMMHAWDEAEPVLDQVNNYFWIPTSKPHLLHAGGQSFHIDSMRIARSTKRYHYGTTAEDL